MGPPNCGPPHVLLGTCLTGPGSHVTQGHLSRDTCRGTFVEGHLSRDIHVKGIYLGYILGTFFKRVICQGHLFYGPFNSGRFICGALPSTLVKDD